MAYWLCLTTIMLYNKQFHNERNLKFIKLMSMWGLVDVI